MRITRQIALGIVLLPVALAVGSLIGDLIGWTIKNGLGLVLLAVAVWYAALFYFIGTKE